MSAVSKENQEDENTTDQAQSGETVNDLNNSENGSSQKKKFGKFRALRSNQQQRLADDQSNDGLNDSKVNDSKVNDSNDSKTNEINCSQTEESAPVQPSPVVKTEQFIPPTLLANNEEAKDVQNEETAADGKPKKGKAARKKGASKVKLNLDEIDDSNSPLRRRSSRLKVLEEKKESAANSEPPAAKQDEAGEPAAADKAPENSIEEQPDSRPENKPNETDNLREQTPKDKKKDKRKKDKKRTKTKHDKRKSSRRKSSKDEQSDEDAADSDAHKPNDSFTPPSSLPANDGGALKPEKVKSRWRRNSELETGSEPNKKDALTSSENLITNHTANSSGSNTAPASGAPGPPPANDENTEPMPEFDKISDNIYRFEKKITKFTKEVKKMVCDCILTKEERARGMMGCGEDCLNRMLMIECGSKCPLENHCANKRFLRRQYSKVEAFKTAKKGWGLRALQPLQPNQFIMEYVGEVIGPDDFGTRVRRFAKEGRKHHFFMALKADEIIDATYRGNITRFVNHSCDPNAETQKWTVNGDLRIGFFSKKFIQPGEEITFNYQFQRYGREAQPCYCESENCRGFIGATDVSDEVDIELDGEESEDDEVSSVKKVKPVKAPLDKPKELTEEFEDLALEEEIDKLKANGGLQNRHQTLMLARLMVRAEDKQSRFKLLEIIRQTKENACIRLLLDYHGLRLLWSWMVDLEDVHLKAEIIGVLEFLQIPNKTMLKDSKVLEVIEKWSLDKSGGEPKTADGRKLSDAKVNEEIKSEESKGEEATKKLTNGDLLGDHAKADSLDDKKMDVSSADESTSAADLKSSSHLKNYNIIKKEAKTAVADQAQQQQTKSAPNIALMAARLFNLWKDLKEVYRIPRLERQKRHEDEKEADRKAMENEAELNARLNNAASFLRRGTKRPLDGSLNSRPPFGAGQNNKQHNSHQQPPSEQQITANKISKEEHRTYYNVELMRKDYEEAMKQYKKQIEQYNIAIQHQLSSMNGIMPMPIQPPMPPAPPNIGSLFPNAQQSGQQAVVQQPIGQQPVIQPPIIQQPIGHQATVQQPIQSIIGQQPINQQQPTQSPSFPNSYNSSSSNLYSIPTDKQASSDFKQEPLFNSEHYPETADYQSNASGYTQSAEPATAYSQPYNYTQTTEPVADVCMESNELIESQTTELEESWNTVYGKLTAGLTSNLKVCTNAEHAFAENVLQSDYHLVDEVGGEQLGSVSDLFGDIYPRPGTYLVSGGRTFFMQCNSNGCQPEEMVVECNFDLPSQQPTKRPLPEHWKQSQDANGFYYYYNKTTNEVRWSPPFDRTELQNKPNSASLPSTNDQNVVVSSAADSTSTPKFDTSSIDASKINLATLNEILKMSNGLTGDECDPRKRLKTESDETTEPGNALSLEMENKIIKFPTYQQNKTERRKSKNERLREIKEIKERFKTGLTEHIKSSLNPYRMHDCRQGKILCDDDFKHVARRLTHEVFGKEIKRTKPENLQLTSSVKQKSRDYVQKFMSKQGPFYKPHEDRSPDEEEEEPRDDKRRRLLLLSPGFHHQTASNSASNSLDTTPRVDTTPKVDQAAPLSPKQPLNAFAASVEAAPEAATETVASEAMSVADLVTTVTPKIETVLPEVSPDRQILVKSERILVAANLPTQTISEPVAEATSDQAIGSELLVNSLASHPKSLDAAEQA